MAPSPMAPTACAIHAPRKARLRRLPTAPPSFAPRRPSSSGTAVGRELGRPPGRMPSPPPAARRGRRLGEAELLERRHPACVHVDGVDARLGPRTTTATAAPRSPPRPTLPLLLLLLLLLLLVLLVLGVEAAAAGGVAAVLPRLRRRRSLPPPRRRTPPPALARGRRRAAPRWPAARRPVSPRVISLIPRLGAVQLAVSPAAGAFPWRRRRPFLPPLARRPLPPTAPPTLASPLPVLPPGAIATTAAATAAAAAACLLARHRPRGDRHVIPVAPIELRRIRSATTLLLPHHRLIPLLLLLPLLPRRHGVQRPPYPRRAAT